MRWLVLAGLLPAMAVAQPGPWPLLVPARDVDVTYRIAGPAAAQIPGGAPDGVRLQWDALGQRLRAQAIGSPTHAITDLGRRFADIVFAAQSTYVEAPLRAGDPFAMVAGESATFIRRGASMVGGLACTEWAVRTLRIDGTGCVTAEGVVLRAAGAFDGMSGTVLAVSVFTVAQPKGAFQPPPGFFRLELGRAPW